MKIFKVNTYEPIAFHLFFKKLFSNHYNNYRIKEESGYKDFCGKHSLLEKDSLNQVQFLQAKFIQQLFTSRYPSNCSQKGALKVPYFWNWVEPNPRGEIIAASTGKKLKDTKPPVEFNKYASMAYVDRTPSLYLKDVVSEDAKYYHADCDTFYTFGWCSEREMSYNLLMSFFGYKGKVVVSGAHSWSELWVEFKTTDNKQKSILLKADNTYDEFDSYEPDNGQTRAAWLADFGPDKYCKWYNYKARSETEKEKLSNVMVGTKASRRIEKMAVEYFFK
ncbi:MAG: hypothetical protein K2X86_01815 [Cytophagaceae bacterium]|nr:hypothetical protein [Cytophagaceae bacterium]